MDLQTYLDKEGLSLKDIADEAKVCTTTIYNVCQRKTDVSVSIAVAIEKACHGYVRCEDMIPLDKLNRKSNRKYTKRLSIQNKIKAKAAKARK